MLKFVKKIKINKKFEKKEEKLKNRNILKKGSKIKIKS